MTPLLEVLTCREEQVLMLIADGFAYREIAVRMGITSRTVKEHARAFREKLDAASNEQAVAIAIRARVIA
jgi:DNA-binding NarL/FixJ family response regulator